MTDDQFEALVRSLFDSPSRRAMLRAIAGSTLGGWLALRAQSTNAKKGGKGGKRKKGGKKKGKKARKVSLSALNMNGNNEVGGGDPLGSGSAQFTIQGNKICGTFQFTSTTAMSNVTGTHIHAGVAGVNGDIVAHFTAPIGQQSCVKCPSSNCPSGKTPAKILANPEAFYANTHTGAFPNGAVRAQLVKS